jgi:hypothetical protein
MKWRYVCGTRETPLVCVKVQMQRNNDETQKSTEKLAIGQGTGYVNCGTDKERASIHSMSPQLSMFWGNVEVHTAVPLQTPSHIHNKTYGTERMHTDR